MQRARWMLLVVVSSLMPSLTFADGPRTPAMASYQSDLIALTSRPYRWEFGDTSQWLFVEPIDTGTYAYETFHPIASLDFRDPGAFARVSKVRELSLLTLAEVGQARFFFGVNNNGLFGLHLGALPRLGDERCVELARMPYLKNNAGETL